MLLQEEIKVYYVWTTNACYAESQEYEQRLMDQQCQIKKKQWLTNLGEH